MISQIKQLQARAFERMLRESGIEAFNGAQGRILYVLWEHERLTITQVGKLTGLAKTSLTGMLDRMEGHGLISRIPDKVNRRQIFVAITPKAKGYQKDYDQVSARMNQRFYQGFTQDQVASFEAQLHKIIANLTQGEDNQ